MPDARLGGDGSAIHASPDCLLQRPISLQEFAIREGLPHCAMETEALADLKYYLYDVLLIKMRFCLFESKVIRRTVKLPRPLVQNKTEA